MRYVALQVILQHLDDNLLFFFFKPKIFGIILTPFPPPHPQRTEQPNSLVNETSEYGCDCAMMPARSVAPDPAAVWPRQVTPAVVWHARLTGGLQRLRQVGDEVTRYALIVLEEQ